VDDEVTYLGRHDLVTIGQIGLGPGLGLDGRLLQSRRARRQRSNLHGLRSLLPERRSNGRPRKRDRGRSGARRGERTRKGLSAGCGR
jgi:hypothetical protein